MCIDANVQIIYIENEYDKKNRTFTSNLEKR
jgi:hypothetical protein